ncbi:hypothetical protein HY546_03615 [archaeon]|nr:hypothetical protein [archaeon]
MESSTDKCADCGRPITGSIRLCALCFASGLEKAVVPLYDEQLEEDEAEEHKPRYTGRCVCGQSLEVAKHAEGWKFMNCFACFPNFKRAGKAEAEAFLGLLKKGQQ